MVMTAQRMTNRYFIISSWKGLRHPAARQLVSVEFRPPYPKQTVWVAHTTMEPRKLKCVRLSRQCYEGGVVNVPTAVWGPCLMDI